MSMLPELLEISSKTHRHLCPRQVLGVRMGMLAALELGLELPQTNKRLLTFVETDGCFADGVSAATGCWLGRRTMRLVDYGKIAATFVDSKRDVAIRIYPHPDARQRGIDYAPNERSRWHTMLAAYQIIPFDELFCWQPVELSLSIKEIIAKPGVRVNCTSCGEEIINQREINRAGKILCHWCAGDGYYKRSAESC